VIVAHLGSGASMCALVDGRSIASSMGFSALDGLPMATRCGSIDPGLVLYLLRTRGMTPEALERMLYRDSGLLGLSGVSGDMRALLASFDPAAREAVDVFVYRIARELGSLAAAAGGLDVLVFTGGIGEHAAPIRAETLAQLRVLGPVLDPARNGDHGDGAGGRITTDGSPLPVLVIPTNEELVIARETARLASLT